MGVLALALAAPAQGASGTWNSAWGRNVAGGGGFGICSTAASCQMGVIGGLGGEMNGPAGVATDAAGNVYVADASNHRIQKFDSSGNFELTWGKDVNLTTAGNVCTAASGNTCQTGTSGGLGGEMSLPYSVATDAGGDVYVADTYSNRIEKFDSSGNFELTWGKGVNSTTAGNVCTAASGNTCQVGAIGGLGGEMKGPFGVATDPDGNVYVADLSNHRIQKFDSSGNFELTWGKGVNLTTAGNICTAASGNTCKAGTAGGLGGEMNFPAGVATDSASNVYVADQNNNRIQKFDSSGAWDRAWGKGVDSTTAGDLCTAASGDTCQAGTTGGLGGIMNQPFHLATDSTSNVYVTDWLNHRIQKFDSSGSWISAWGKNVNGGGVFGICTVAASCQTGSIGALGGELNVPIGIGTDAAGDVYVGDYGNQRVQKFGSPGVTTPSPTPIAPVAPAGATAPTGQRAAALKKCKKRKTSKARKKCKGRANRLPL